MFYGPNKIYDTKVRQTDVIIPYEVVEGYSGRITAYLLNENHRVTSSFNFYLNTPVVGKVNIVSPSDLYQMRWNDLTLTFTGGNNANHFFVNLISEEGASNRIELRSENGVLTIPAEAFQEDTNYTVVLEAVYEDYVEIAEKDRIQVHVGKKETTSGVFSSHNPTFIRSGTEVSLYNIMEDAKIYYTTDGTDPTVLSSVYEKPFTILEDTVIKVLSVSANRYDSAIQTFHFQIGEKTPVIFLSPSNQNENYGVASVGYTTEMDIMNQLADVVERRLKEANFLVYRNNPYTDIDAWTSTSNYVKADFHFAIHSNASLTHQARGIEIYVDKPTSLSFSIASNIYENLWGIYPDHSNYSYHRGVKFAQGTLGEANDSFVPCGALIEVAYHDEYHDAAWVMSNMEEIGQNLANSIISYYN